MLVEEELLYEPVRVPWPADELGDLDIEAVAAGLGLSWAGFAAFRGRGFGPRHSWRKSISRFVCRQIDVEAWWKNPWRSGERKALAELQGQFPARFLNQKAV